MLFLALGILEEFPFANVLAPLPVFQTGRFAICRKRNRNVLDEVFLAPAGGLDGRRLLDSLGAAAAKEGNAAEHGAEDTDGELLNVMRQLLCKSPMILYATMPAQCAIPSPSVHHFRARGSCSPEC